MGNNKSMDDLFTGHQRKYQETALAGPVTCLGKTFDNDQARRAYFTEELRKKLQEPDFRKIDGFPIGSDEGILNLSDPPYYTACPNPWIADFIEEWEDQKPELPENDYYHRKPLDVEVNASRNNKFVNAHSYATKTPHEAIMRWLLHYTNPGDIVLDMFAGTGMTSVAAQLCGAPEDDFKTQIDSSEEKVKWGVRNSIIGDLGVAPAYIARNLNFEDSHESFIREVDSMVDRIKKELSWMYKTKLHSGQFGDIVAVLWSDIYLCSNCSEEFTYWDAAVDVDSGTVAEKVTCPICGSENDKRKLIRAWSSEFDEVLGTTIRLVRTKPVVIIYDHGGKRFEKEPDEHDLDVLNKIRNFKIPYWVPKKEMPAGFNTDQPRRSHGLTHVHHFYTKRNLAMLSCAWTSAKSERAKFLLTSLMYKSSVLCAPLMSNYFAEKKGKPRGGWIGKERSGTLYCPAIHSEVMLLPQISSRAKSAFVSAGGCSKPVITTQSATKLDIPNNSIDYIFTDPPFGANRMYSELNFIWEAWLGVTTENRLEAIENPARDKTIGDYRELLLACFKEYYRVLKPGRWITVEFSNTKALVWNTLQTVIGEAGFVVAAVSGLDKKQGSIEAYTSSIAVTKDLVISAYKPNGGFEERFQNEAETEEGVWDFVRTHLKYLPVTKQQEGVLQFVSERDPRILFDQMVAYYVRKGYPVPISSLEFQVELAQRFIERDGMYFLPDQVAEYDRNKMISGELKQMALFVSDEASAIRWLRQLIKEKPQTFSDINPQFMQQLGGWNKNEAQLDLRELLNQNFLSYDGKGLVPEQIHAYLSTNWKELRNLPKDDSALVSKARDRWYVPDPNKAGDLEKLREKALLKEFEEYKEVKKKLKVFRLEAVRAGFKKSWQERDYAVIIAVAEKIANNVLEEDPKLLMWYDQAVTRLGADN